MSKRASYILFLLIALLYNAFNTVNVVAAKGESQRPSDYLLRGQAAAKLGNDRLTVSIYDSLLSKPGLRNSVKFMAYDGRARALRKLGDYGSAIADYDSALSLPVSVRNKAIITLNKANVLLSTGQYLAALESINAIDSTTMDPDIRYRAMGDKAAALLRLAKYDEAELLYRALLNIDHPAIEKDLTSQNLGFLLMISGRPTEGSEYLGKALVLSNFNEKPSVRGAIILSNLALAEAMTGKTEKAINDIDYSLSILKSLLGEKHSDYITALRKKAEIYLMCGDNASALSIFKPYYLLLRDNVITNFPKLTEQGRLDYWKKEKPLMSEIFATGNEDADFLLDVSLLRRAIALTGADKAFGPTSKSKLAVTGKDLKKYLRKGETLVDFIVYPHLDSLGNISNRMGALTLHEDKTLFIDLGSTNEIEHWRVAGRNFGSASRSNNNHDKNAVYSDTTLFNKIWGAILDSAPHTRHIYFTPDGLFNLAAIESLRRPDSRPDAANIKFHRLTSPANLIHRYNTRRKKNTTLVAGGLRYDQLPSEKSGSPNHDALKYMVQVNNGRQILFVELNGMKREAEAIDSIVSNSALYSQLSEEKFKRVIGNYHRMHFSTHGYTLALDEPQDNLFMRDTIDADNSLLASGLVLSGANVSKNYPERDDGLLSARELCNLDLSNIDFAVLAACQTAVGHINDEGPAGILRGLKKAGVHTVMATLWEVNDDATLLFMTTFYSALNKGLSNYDAYHEAIDTVRNFQKTEPVISYHFDTAKQASVPVNTGKTRTVKPFSKPSMWAPFILIDDI